MACVMLHDRNFVPAYLNITVCAVRDRTACADDEVSSLATLAHNNSHVLKAALVTLVKYKAQHKLLKVYTSINR